MDDKISLLTPKMPNCATLVAKKVLTHFPEVDDDMTPELLFGMDLLGEKNICGAISGGIVAINKILLGKGISDEDLKYTLEQYLDNFKSKYNGAITCSEIREKYGNDKKCTDMINESLVDIQEIVDYIRNVINPTYTGNLRR